MSTFPIRPSWNKGSSSRLATPFGRVCERDSDRRRTVLRHSAWALSENAAHPVDRPADLRQPAVVVMGDKPLVVGQFLNGLASAGQARLRLPDE